MCYVDKFLQEVKTKGIVMNPTILLVTEKEDLLVRETRGVNNNCSMELSEYKKTK